MADGITIEMLAKASELKVSQGVSVGGVAIQMLHYVGGVLVTNGDAVAIETRAAREVELGNESGVIRWRYRGDASWQDLIDLSGVAAELVVQCESAADFPVLGSSSKLYIDKATERSYRWDSDSHHYYCVGADYSKVTVVNGNII